MKELVKEKQNIIGQEWVKESTYQENHAKTTTKITKKKHPTAIPRISILLNLSEKIKDMIEFRSSCLKITTKKGFLVRFFLKNDIFIKAIYILQIFISPK